MHVLFSGSRGSCMSNFQHLILNARTCTNSITNVTNGISLKEIDFRARYPDSQSDFLPDHHPVFLPE